MSDLPHPRTDLESFSSYLTQIDGITLTYDGIRNIVMHATRFYIPKLHKPSIAKYYGLVVTQEVLTFLQSITRPTLDSYEHVFISYENYRGHVTFDNEVGAIHEFRFFLANDTCSPTLVKFMTDPNQRHQILCDDPLTFSITL